MPRQLCLQCDRLFDAPEVWESAEVTCPHCGQRTLLQPVRIPTSATLKLPPLTATPGLTMEEVAHTAGELIANVEKVIVGKRTAVEITVATLLAEGHLLIEDVPGVAKTMLARALAISAGCTFNRIQCTPDLEPGDVLGQSVLDPKTGRSEFHFGPLFAQVVLVDEINRSSPRTQAALLEAMGERTVTEGRVTYDLERPFMLLATQNPIEQEGTFQLPEAQLDRFLLRLSLGYPTLAAESEMCERFQLRHPIETLKSCTTPERIMACQQTVRTVTVSPAARDYILAVVHATRRHPDLLLGASPRGSLGLLRMAQAKAALQGRDAVSLSQIRELVAPVLRHRLLVQRNRPDLQADAVLAEILQQLPSPAI